MPGTIKLNINGRSFNVDWHEPRPPTDAEVSEIESSIRQREGIGGRNAVKARPQGPPQPKIEPFRPLVDNDPSRPAIGARIPGTDRVLADVRRDRESVDRQVAEEVDAGLEAAKRTTANLVDPARKTVPPLAPGQFGKIGGVDFLAPRKIEPAKPKPAPKKAQGQLPDRLDLKKIVKEPTPDQTNERQRKRFEEFRKPIVEAEERKKNSPEAKIAGLPFTLEELTRANQQGGRTVRTKAGGVLPMSQAIALFQKATGKRFTFKPVEDDNAAAFAGNYGQDPTREQIAGSNAGKPYIPVAKEEPEKFQTGTLTNLTEKTLRRVLERNGIPKEVVEEYARSGATQAGNTVANFVRYFIPGVSQTSVAEDAATVAARSEEVGIPQAAKEAAEGFLEGMNVFAPDISGIERAMRFLNAGVALLGAGAGIQRMRQMKGSKAQIRQIADEFGISENEARVAIAEVERKTGKQAPAASERATEPQTQAPPPRIAPQRPETAIPKVEPTHLPKVEKAGPAVRPEPAGVAVKTAPEGFTDAMGFRFTEERVAPSTIGVKKGLQYKRVGVTDFENAVTPEYKNVEKYDQATAGPLTVWETADGKRWVMNGHHRREIAIRTNEPNVPVRIYREAESVDFTTARSLGALQNIRDGKGTAIDAATVLRDLDWKPEELKGVGLNPRNGIAQDAISLLKLDSDALRMVEEGQVREAVAAGIADAKLDPRRQVAVMKLAGDLETRRQGEILANRAKSAPMVDRSGGNGDLFGEFSEDLALVEQTKLIDGAVKRLSTSQRMYTAMTKGKAVGETKVDVDAQTRAASVQEFARKVLATDPDVARIIEQEAKAYASKPTRKQLEQSIDRIVQAAEPASERRLAELDPRAKGQDPEVGVRRRAGSGPEDPVPGPQQRPQETPPVTKTDAFGQPIAHSAKDLADEAIRRYGDTPLFKRLGAENVRKRIEGPSLTRHGLTEAEAWGGSAKTLEEGAANIRDTLAQWYKDRPDRMERDLSPEVQSAFARSQDPSITPEEARTRYEQFQKLRQDRPETPDSLIDVPEDLTLEGDKPKPKPKPQEEPNAQPPLSPEEIGDGKGQLGLRLDEMKDGEPGPFSSNPQAGGRIHPKPEAGWQGGQVSDIILELGDIPDRKVAQGVATMRRAGGFYKPGTAQTTIRFANDISVTAHEIAHALDDKFGIVGEWLTEKSSPFDDELRWFWERGGSGGPDKSLAYNRAEGVAEYIRGYLVNPEAARKIAPDFAKHFESAVPASVLKRIDAVGQKIRQWYGANPLEKTKSVIRTERPAQTLQKRVETLIDGAVNRQKGEGYETSWSDTLRELFTDELAPFVTAVKEAAKRRGFAIDRLRPANNPVMLARQLPYHVLKYERILRDGMIDKEGNVVTPPARYLVRSLDNSSPQAMAKDLADLEALLVSERTIEKANHLADAAEQQIEGYAKAVQDRIAVRVESEEIRLRAESQPEMMRQIGRVQERAKQKRLVDGKGKTADERNKIDARTNKARDKQVEKIRAKFEQQVQQRLSEYHARQQAIAQGMIDRYARRVERNLEIKQSRLTGAGGGFLNATDIAKGTVAELAKDPKRFARLSLAAAAYRNWSDTVLQYMVAKGRISREAYRAIKSRNEQYAAMKRFFDEEIPEEFKRAGMAGAKETLKKFGGSTRTIESPLSSLLQSTFAMVREADRNEAMAAFARLLTTGRGMYEGSPANLAAIGQRVDAGTAGAVRVFIRGKEQHWLFEKGIDGALKRVANVNMPHIVGRFFEIPVRTLRSGITKTPPFAVRNRIRDTLETLVKAPHEWKPSDWTKLATEEEKALYDLFGGGIGRDFYMESASDFYDVRNRVMDEMLATGGKNVVLRAFTPQAVKTLLGKYDDLLQSSEKGPRLAAMRSARRVAEAKYASTYDQRIFTANTARELIDFAQGGTVTKFVSRYMVPFTNAAVQGLRSTLSLAQKNPRQFAKRVVLFSVLPELAVYAWNRARGEEAFEEYRQLPPWQKDFFYNLKIAPDTWLRIPKAHMLGVAGSAFSRMVDLGLGKPQAMDGYGESVKRAVFVLDENAFIGGPLGMGYQAKANYDAFRGAPIVAKHEEDLALELRRGDKNASDLGQAIQQLTGLDARKADFLARGLFGEAGNILTTLTDIGAMDRLMAEEGEDEAPGRSPSTTRRLNAVFGTFAQSPSTSSPVVREVFEMNSQSGSPVNPLGGLLDDYYAAKTPEERDEASKALRKGAEEVFKKALRAAGGKQGKAKQEAIRAVMQKSPYQRERKKQSAGVNLLGGKGGGKVKLTPGSSRNKGVSLTGDK